MNSQEEDEQVLGSYPSVLEVENALNVNALNVNALNVNALNVNALNVNALNVNALTAIQNFGPDGELSRQLLLYTVECAFTSTQFFSFSWIDSQFVVHNETYSGKLGLAPSWFSAPLADTEQRWISACLASRVNWYGVHVIISSRASSSRLGVPSTIEKETFTNIEGAFWGSLFTGSPQVYACYSAPNAAHSRSKMRDCAAGHVDENGIPQDCGIIHIVGTCESVCEPMKKEDRFYPSCTSDGGATWTDQVITVFLE
jgi:hypothetical protein